MRYLPAIALGAIALVVLSMSPRSGAATTIPSDVKKTVAFVFRGDSKGGLALDKQGRALPLGTGFFVGVPAEGHSERVHLYFVTARHVIREPRNGPIFPYAILRLNQHDGTAGYVRLKLLGDGQRAFFHQDAEVDLAVVPVQLDSMFDFKFIKREHLTSKKEYDDLNIVEGTDVFFAGLFTYFFGAQRNYPVIRFGKVALVTTERIPWDGKHMDLYLMETASYGGNSGSPVFFYAGTNQPNVYSLFTLAGVMMGSFLDVRPIVGIPQSNLVPGSQSNIGIAAVIPCYKLYEILFGADLQARRRIEVQEFQPVDGLKSK